MLPIQITIATPAIRTIVAPTARLGARLWSSTPMRADGPIPRASGRLTRRSAGSDGERAGERGAGHGEGRERAHVEDELQDEQQRRGDQRQHARRALDPALRPGVARAPGGQHRHDAGARGAQRRDQRRATPLTLPAVPAMRSGHGRGATHDAVTTCCRLSDMVSASGRTMSCAKAQPSGSPTATPTSDTSADSATRRAHQRGRAGTESPPHAHLPEPRLVHGRQPVAGDERRQDQPHRGDRVEHRLEGRRRARELTLAVGDARDVEVRRQAFLERCAHARFGRRRIEHDVDLRQAAGGADQVLRREAGPSPAGCRPRRWPRRSRRAPRAG